MDNKQTSNEKEITVKKKEKDTLKIDTVQAIIATFITLVVGVLLVVFRPTLFGISENFVVVLGALMIAIGVIFTPSMVYIAFRNLRR